MKESFVPLTDISVSGDRITSPTTRRSSAKDAPNIDEDDHVSRPSDNLVR
jgi:hypothetical protein